jgi:hypothetical protein
MINVPLIIDVGGQIYIYVYEHCLTHTQSDSAGGNMPFAAFNESSTKHRQGW